VRHLFVAARWRPARRVSVDDRVPEHHPAHDVLREMGGLHVCQAGYGIECAGSVLINVERTAHEQVDGVAEVHRSHGLLLMDEAGRCFGASLIHDAFYFEGHNFGEAPKRLLLGPTGAPTSLATLDYLQIAPAMTLTNQGKKALSSRSAIAN
jgi:hypothetical protein